MKLLIISNNPLSFSNSNGRTMLNMLVNFKREQVFNFFINGSNPSLDRGTFVKINEKQLVKPFYRCKLLPIYECGQDSDRMTKRRKTALLCIIRSLLWTKACIKKELLTFIDTNKIDRIVLQCGDSDFLIKLAVKLSQKSNVKLFAYNSEDYPFKTWDYFKKSLNKNLFYSIYSYMLRKSYDLLFERLDSCIYLTDSLRCLYKSRYPNHKDYVIYNSSSLSNVEKYNYKGDIVYSGNIGVGRIYSLMKVAKYTKKYFHKNIIVYSNTKNKELIDLATNADCLTYKGSLSYNDNIKVIRDAAILIHAESFDPFYRKDTKNAFSTKIADSLSLGIPFLVFSPKDSFVTTYLNNYECAFVCTNEEELASVVCHLSLDNDYLLSKRKRALDCSRDNHDCFKNSRFFYDIIKG